MGHRLLLLLQQQQPLLLLSPRSRVRACTRVLINSVRNDVFANLNLVRRKKSDTIRSDTISSAWSLRHVGVSNDIRNDIFQPRALPTTCVRCTKFRCSNRFGFKTNITINPFVFRRFLRNVGSSLVNIVKITRELAWK